MLKLQHDMENPHWFTWFARQLDPISMYLFGGTAVTGTITHLTSNEISAFFTVMGGMGTLLYTLVKTKIALNKEKDRKKREAKGWPPLAEDKDED